MGERREEWRGGLRGRKKNSGSEGRACVVNEQNLKLSPQHQANLIANEANAFKKNEDYSEKGYVPKYRVVHLDLKGAPPTLEYLEKILPIIQNAGGNTILMEYEDMFPFWGKLAPIAASNAFTRKDIATFLKLAKKFKFEVIPLVQTFGHMEYVLKLKEFKHLRELDQYPGALCPSKNESLKVVSMMIDQMMELHKNVKWLHIGCDEVFQLGQCPKCMYVNRNNLLLSHVQHVARYVRNTHNVIPIVWDDMFRNMDSIILKEYNLGELVEPMIWVYIQDIMRFIPQGTWYMFGEVFPNIWVASAFKGAFGETLTVPNIKQHLENNEAWLQVMDEQKNTVKNFRGIVITGWQRYDHFGTLCETLPVGFPSLILNMLTVTKGYFDESIFHSMKILLQCTSTYNLWRRTDLDEDPYLYSKLQFCFYPGSQVYQLTKRVSQQVKAVNDYVYSYTIHKSWFTDYNIRRNYTNPQRVDEAMEEFHMVYYDLTSTVSTAREALRKVFDEYTVAEWIEQNLYPYVLKMEKIKEMGEKLKARRVWPKRPLLVLNDLRRFNLGEDGMKNKENISFLVKNILNCILVPNCDVTLQTWTTTNFKSCCFLTRDSYLTAGFISPGTPVSMFGHTKLTQGIIFSKALCLSLKFHLEVGGTFEVI
ncbi:Hexosaminidase D [Nymphon striatum]|nr:Hexosaminidase D [Nymphon striatum]